MGSTTQASATSAKTKTNVKATVLKLWAEKEAALKSGDTDKAKALRRRLRALHYKQFITVPAKTASKPKTAVKATKAVKSRVAVEEDDDEGESEK
jgi:hypothetical protein